jgi:predicted nucleic acid-binding protein
MCEAGAERGALLIVFEMTHQFSMVPALMFCSLVSQAIGRLGGHHNFYDALLLRCARKCNAQTIYTWNVKHFEAIAPDLAPRLRMP